jgi:hypothetical protein
MYYQNLSFLCPKFWTGNEPIMSSYSTAHDIDSSSYATHDITSSSCGIHPDMVSHHHHIFQSSLYDITASSYR